MRDTEQRRGGIEWRHECVDGWGDEVITGPFGAGDAQPKPKCTKKEEMNLGRYVKIIMPDALQRDRDRELQWWIHH